MIRLLDQNDNLLVAGRTLEEAISHIANKVHEKARELFDATFFSLTLDQLIYEAPKFYMLHAYGGSLDTVTKTLTNILRNRFGILPDGVCEATPWEFLNRNVALGPKQHYAELPKVFAIQECVYESSSPGSEVITVETSPPTDFPAFSTIQDAWFYLSKHIATKVADF